MRRNRTPSRRRRGRYGQDHAWRRLEGEVRDDGAIGVVVEHVRLLSRSEVAQVALQRRCVGLPLRILELGNRDCRENSDDHHYDQQFDQSKAPLVLSLVNHIASLEQVHNSGLA